MRNAVFPLDWPTSIMRQSCVARRMFSNVTFQSRIVILLGQIYLQKINCSVYMKLLSYCILLDMKRATRLQ